MRPSPIEIGGTRIPWYAAGKASTMFGGSSVDDDRLEILQLGSQDPKHRGFVMHEVTIESGIDLFDEYLGGDVKLSSVLQDGVEDIEDVELAEAALHSEIRNGVALSAGRFRAPFGNHNMYFERAWHFVDAPVIRTRLLGDSGFNSLGISAAYHDVANRVRVHLGAQDLAEGDSKMPGFAGDGLTPIWRTTNLTGQDFTDVVVHGRIAHVARLGSCTAMQIGASAIYGPNTTGEDGHTLVYGADLRIDRARDRTGKELKASFTAEFMRREIRTDDYVNTAGMVVNSLPKTTIEDWGFYAQGLVSIGRSVALGLRYDHATGNKDSWTGFDAGSGAAIFRPRRLDERRHTRHRISALALLPISFNQSNITLANKTMEPVVRLRVQYSYDIAQLLGGDQDAHTLWIGFETEVASGGS